MNFYKKINTFTLERLPTIWNTQFVWMILISIVTHVLYFGLGYATLQLDDLTEYGTSSIFFGRGYFTFYIIIGLMALIFFAFRYFSHNPFKSFYPVSQMYFWKIFAQLFTMFLLFGTVFISFENGMIVKSKKIAPLAVIEKEVLQVNYAMPLLFNDIADYHIENRSYPSPFPCDEISDFVVGYDSTNSSPILHNIDYKKPYLNLNYNLYQFGRIKQKAVDSCFSDEVLDTIYDVSKVYGIAQYSLYNYSKNKNNTYQNVDYTAILPTIHKWYTAKDTVAIEACIANLKALCKKYDVGEQLYPLKMAKAILEQNLDKQPFIRTEFTDYRDKLNSTDISEPEQNESNGNIKKNIAYNYSVDVQVFYIIQQNVSALNDDLGFNQIHNSAIWALVFFAFFAALFFISIKYIALKDFIISVFVAGVLATLLALYIFVTDAEREKTFTLISIIYALIIIIIGVVGIHTTKVKKRYLTKWQVSMYIAILCLLPAILVCIRENTVSKVLLKCSNDYTDVYLFEFKAWHFFTLLLIAVYFIFSWLRKLHARVE